MNVPPSITANPSHLWSAALRDNGPPAEFVALVARAKGGDRDAYTVLYRRYLKEVFRFALVRLGNREAAEDATQMVFVRALAALPSCRENAAFVGWLLPLPAAWSPTSCASAAASQTDDPIPDDAGWADAGPDQRRWLCRGRLDASCLPPESGV